MSLDDADFTALSGWHWNDNGRYAYRTKDKRRIYMHREITAASTGLEVDHIDGDGYNNCRANLRVVTHAQNLRNTNRHIDNTSGYKGVHWDATWKGWRADLYINGKNVSLGRFADPREAAAAWDKATRKAFGATAKTNGIGA